MVCRQKNGVNRPYHGGWRMESCSGIQKKRLKSHSQVGIAPKKWPLVAQIRGFIKVLRPPKIAEIYSFLSLFFSSLLRSSLLCSALLFSFLFLSSLLFLFFFRLPVSVRFFGPLELLFGRFWLLLGLFLHPKRPQQQPKKAEEEEEESAGPLAQSVSDNRQ